MSMYAENFEMAMLCIGAEILT